jgi:uncharacterized membrane protein
MTEKPEETRDQGGLKSLLNELPLDRFKDELQESLSSLGQRAVDAAGDRLTGLTDKLNDVAEGGPIGKAKQKGVEEAAKGGSPVKGAIVGGLTGAKDKVKEKLGGGGGNGDGKANKATNIIEEIDVGVPISAAYNQWTQFQDYSNFMKKVEDVDQVEEVKVNFKAQVFWSHRKWEATIIEQVPDERIVWRSKGEKGHVDGSVTFHELAPRLTRIVVVMEYYPQGLFERTGNLWRAQGRRARLELKNFRRHLMMLTEEELEELEGWRGEIRDKDVERSHEEVVEDEEQAGDEYEEEPEDEGESEEGEYEEEPEDEAESEEGEYEEEPEEGEYEEEPEDEAESEEGEYEEEPEDEAESDEGDEFEEGDEYEGESEEDEEAPDEGESEESEDEASDEYEEEPEEGDEEYDEDDEEPADAEEYEEEPEEAEEEPAPRRRRRRS